MSTKNPSKALPVTLIPGINRIKPAHDRDKLKHVKSPDVSLMPFSYHDPVQKYTKYFNSLERKNRFLEKLAAMPNNDPLKKGGRPYLHPSAKSDGKG